MQENFQRFYTPLHAAVFTKERSHEDPTPEFSTNLDTYGITLLARTKSQFSYTVIDIRFLILSKIIDTVKRFPAGYFKDRMLTKAKQNIQTEIWRLPCVETRKQAEAEVQSASS